MLSKFLKRGCDLNLNPNLNMNLNSLLKQAKDLLLKVTFAKNVEFLDIGFKIAQRILNLQNSLRTFPQLVMFVESAIFPGIGFKIAQRKILLWKRKRRHVGFVWPTQNSKSISFFTWELSFTLQWPKAL
jgi:hypothetical protein